MFFVDSREGALVGAAEGERVVVAEGAAFVGAGLSTLFQPEPLFWLQLPALSRLYTVPSFAA